MTGNNHDSIKDAVKDYFNNIRLNIAQAIRNRDWSVVGWNIALILAIMLVAMAVAVATLALMGKVLGTLLGKVFAVPLVLFILGMSYKMNYEDSRATHRKKSEPATWDEWASSVYDYVRDAVFLVFRSVSEYGSTLIMPTWASAIESEEPYTVEDGYVVFHFICRTCGRVDTDQLWKDMRKTLRQMHRAHQLNGFSSDLTEINGAFYCPLQIWGEPQDYGDHVRVSVVFATEKTVTQKGIYKTLNLKGAGRTRGPRGATLTDDEI